MLSTIGRITAVQSVYANSAVLFLQSLENVPMIKFIVSIGLNQTKCISMFSTKLF